MDAKQVLAMIKEKDVKFVDFRFTDPRGKWQHTARMASATQEDSFTDGVMFDGSSIAGWKAINESDMILMPDADTAVMDPFSAKPSLILFCDIVGSTDVLSARTATLGDAVRWSGEVLEMLTGCVRDSGGTLIDYTGDGLFALWGAPIEQPDHEESG